MEKRERIQVLQVQRTVRKKIPSLNLTKAPRISRTRVQKRVPNPAKVQNSVQRRVPRKNPARALRRVQTGANKALPLEVIITPTPSTLINTPVLVPGKSLLLLLAIAATAVRKLKLDGATGSSDVLIIPYAAYALLLCGWTS